MEQETQKTNAHAEKHCNLHNLESEINLLDCLLVIVQHKKMILWASATVFVLACVSSFLMSDIYVSTARVLPPAEKNSNLSSLISQAGDLAALANFSSINGSGQLYEGMLKSRTVADAIIDKFDLMKIYDKKYRVKMYEALVDIATFELKDDGILTVVVQDEDPQRAADIANSYVEELKKLNLRLNLASAGKERVFLEERLQVVKKDLVKTEEALKVFQEQNKAFRIDDQGEMVLVAIAELKSKLASKEVELGVLLSYQTEQNSQVLAVRKGIAQIKAQLQKLKQTSTGNEVREDTFVPTAEMPVLGVQFSRLMRDFKVQETLFEIVMQQYELAKLSEAKNTSTLQVIDKAIPADKKSKPNRALIVVVATFLAGIITVVTVIVLESLVPLSSGDQERLRKIKAAFVGSKETLSDGLN